MFETGRGTWAVLLGDVCGKGAAAAVLTAFTRYTVRAEALHTPNPSTVLAALNEAFLHYHPDQFCTLLCLILDRTAGHRSRLTLASAGHPLPLRLTGGGRLETLGHGGTLIGLGATPRLSDATVVLDPGDVVVLYTDGVTEARHDQEFFGQDRLRAIVADAASRHAQQIADDVVTAAVDFQDGYARDDIAVLVVKADPRA